MKKMAIFLAVLLVISATMTMAVDTYALTIRPQLSFSGTTANCGVTVVGGTMSDHVEVEMKLMHGSTCVATWSADSYGYVVMKETTGVTKGQTYELVVAVTVNGVSKTPVTHSGTC